MSEANLKLIKNMIYSTSYQLLALILPLVTAPYVSRILEPEGIGIFSVTSAYATYFVLLGGMGITLYGNREIAYAISDIKKRSKLFFEINALRGGSVLVSSIIFIISIWFQPQYQNLYLLQGILIIATALDISWFFMGMENFKVVVVRNTIIRIITVILTFILVRTVNDLWIYILLVVISQLFSNLSLWPFLRKNIIYIPPIEWKVLRHLKPTLWLFLPQIATQIYLSLNKNMLGVLDGMTAAGYFNQSDTIIRVSFTVVSSFGAAFLPRLSSMYAQGQTEDVQKLTLKSLDLSYAISFLIMAGIMGVSHTFATFFFGKQYDQVSGLMLVQATMIIFVALASVLGNQYLLSSGRTKEFAISSLWGLVVNIALNLMLIPKIGAMGAVISTVFTEVATTSYQLWVLRDTFTLKEIFHGVWKYMIGGVVVFIVLFTLNNNMTVSALNYLIQTIISILIYLVILYVLRAPVNSLVSPYIKKLLKK